MRQKKDLIASQAKLSPSEVSDLQWINVELEKFIENKTVNEDELVRLENLTSSLLTLKDTYVKRLISLLKQGHMLD
mgnify:CR=1 FL=1|tara:strand:- start:2882 stop:3109 length:228 start_codon:yes stop_codon:yes gene_type:complete